MWEKKDVEQENTKNEKTGRELCIAAALLSDDPSRAPFPNLHLKDYRMLIGHSMYKTRIQLYYLLLLLLYTGRENKVIESLMNNKRRQRREWICISSVAPAISLTIHTHLNPSAFWIDSDADYYIKRKRIECKKEARMKKRRWTNRKKSNQQKKNTQEEEEKKRERGSMDEGGEWWWYSSWKCAPLWTTDSPLVLSFYMYYIILYHTSTIYQKSDAVAVVHLVNCCCRV